MTTPSPQVTGSYEPRAPFRTNLRPVTEGLPAFLRCGHGELHRRAEPDSFLTPSAGVLERVIFGRGGIG